MKKAALAVAMGILGLGFTRPAHAVPITVWLYGDGQTTRMFSELDYLWPGTGITPIKKAVETTGPDLSPTLAQRIYWDLATTPVSSWPDLIHIGYNASAFSYYNCGLPNWSANLVAIAASEANAIKAGADLAYGQGIQVLLSRGPGAPTASPMNQCMNQAIATVNYFLGAIAGSYPYVDYSGMTAGVIGGTPDPQLKLPQNEWWHWEHTETSRIHVSCDKARYFYPAGQVYPHCVTVANETDRKKLGSWRIAKTVMKAYQTFQ